MKSCATASESSETQCLRFRRFIIASGRALRARGLACSGTIALILFLSLPGCTIRDGKVYFLDQGTKSVKKPKVEPTSKKEVRVLVVEDTSKRPRLPGPQAAIFTSRAVREYLNEHCHKNEDGSPEFFFLDVHDDVSELPDIFQQTFKRSRKSDFWFYVTDGKRGTEGPLPEDSDRFIAILKVYCE